VLGVVGGLSNRRRPSRVLRGHGIARSSEHSSKRQGYYGPDEERRSEPQTEFR
jgi:hypothetical protein